MLFGIEKESSKLTAVIIVLSLLTIGTIYLGKVIKHENENSIENSYRNFGLQIDQQSQSYEYFSQQLLYSDDKGLKKY